MHARGYEIMYHQHFFVTKVLLSIIRYDDQNRCGGFWGGGGGEET